MSSNNHVYGTVDNKADLQRVFREIRKDVTEASSRAELTELYRRAGYLVTLTYSPAWQKKFNDEIHEIRRIAADEFARTARIVNRRASEIGTDANYDETWGS